VTRTSESAFAIVARHDTRHIPTKTSFDWYNGDNRNRRIEREEVMSLFVLVLVEEDTQNK